MIMKKFRAVTYANALARRRREGGGIIAGNLSLYLDPSNTSSYSGSGNTYTDLSTAGNTFTKTAGTFVSSPIKSFSGGIFNRTNFLGSDVTIQAWINTTGVGSPSVGTHRGQMQIMSAELSGNPTNPTDFGFGINNAGKLGFGTGASDVTVYTTTSVNTGVWLNVAVVRTAVSGGVKLYINGVLSKTGNTDANVGDLTAQTNLAIGTGGDGGVSWTGLMGSILVYNSSLTDADILQNFTSQQDTYGLA
jgi:hypothetical protein